MESSVEGPGIFGIHKSNLCFNLDSELLPDLWIHYSMEGKSGLSTLAIHIKDAGSQQHIDEVFFFLSLNLWISVQQVN